MPTAYKVLGQSGSSGNYGNGAQTLSAANTAYNLYTVPSATSAVVSTIVVCNQAAASGTFRIAVRPTGTTLAAQHYIAYDTPIAGNDSTTITLGVTLTATDIITFQASATTMSFTVFGSEIS